MKQQSLKQFFFLLITAISFTVHDATAAVPDSWWPEQKRPDHVIKCIPDRQGGVVEMNVAQSLCGLAAQAVNTGTCNEAIWVECDNKDYDTYYNAWLRRLKITEHGHMNVWEAVRHYQKKGVVKGYILYDYSRRDNSVNLATVLAGLHQGILVDISLEEKARKTGLKRLCDATVMKFGKAEFNRYKSQLNNGYIVLANPETANNRDYVIAHKGMAYYGVDDMLDTILEWVRPLSPAVGWNSGPEFDHIAPCTRWGLINTASDWCMNLSMLSVRGNEKIKKLKTSGNHTGINADTHDCSYHSFVMSDGDNMQWTLGNFINNPDYLNNPYCSKIPMTFTTCMVNLSMAAPDVLNCLIDRQPDNVSFVEYGGGYYYPDLFAENRSNRWDLLRDFARIVNKHMQRVGCKVFGFICRNIDSENAMQAYHIFAEELHDIAGMIAVQYSPYNGGYGKVYWPRDRQGHEIPVLSARYQIWANLEIEKSGTPSQIASNINSDARQNIDNASDMSWTIIHAWSRYNRNNGSDIVSAQQNSDGTRGVTPVYWGCRLLDKNIKVVPVEELLWRMRIKHEKQ